MTEDELVDGIAVRTEQDGSRAVLSLTGELDLVSAPRVRSAIGALRADAVDEIVIDLAGLSYIDSVGIGSRPGGGSTLRAAGSRFATPPRR